MNEVTTNEMQELVHGPAEQPGVLATLSQWRSWVQIPSGLRIGRSELSLLIPDDDAGSD